MKNVREKHKGSAVVAIPVYNEETYLNQVLDEVKQYIDHVIVIDDGSTDGTKRILAERNDVCVVQHRQNCGYGHTISQAFQFADNCGFDWVITMDCDFQHEPARIPDFLEKIAKNDADIISGSRYLHESIKADLPPTDRRHINFTVSNLLRANLGLDLTDSFCGFKACRVSSMKKMELTESGYAFPLEFWVQAMYHQLRICEIPVSLIYNDPNRHFGGDLDDPETRLDHYKEVFNRSLENVGWSHLIRPCEPCNCKRKIQVT